MADWGNFVVTLKENKDSEYDTPYIYRLANKDGGANKIYPCTEVQATTILPLLYQGATFNYDVISGVVVFKESVDSVDMTNVDDLDYDENAKRVSLFEGVAVDGEEDRELNVTKLEESRSSESAQQRKLTYKQMLAVRKQHLNEINKEYQEEAEREYSIVNTAIDDEIAKNGVYFDENLGCKALVAGHGDEYDHLGVASIMDMPVPTPKLVKRYEEAVKAGLPEDKLPLSPAEIRALCSSIIPTSNSKPVGTTSFKKYENIPMYDENARLLAAYTKNKTVQLINDKVTVADKWMAVIEMISRIDALVEGLLTLKSIQLIFTERPEMTMAVSATKLIIGIDFLLEHSVQQCAFVLLHEARHLLFEHTTRRGYREAGLWNLATDLVINKQIVDSYAVDPTDKTGGLLALRLKDKNNAERTIFVSDGRPSPRFVIGGVYSSEIDVANDTAEKVYTCLEMGVDSYDAALEAKRMQKQGGMPSSIKGYRHVTARDVINQKFTQEPESEETENTNGGQQGGQQGGTQGGQQGGTQGGQQGGQAGGVGGGTSGGAGGEAILETWDTSAYLFKVVQAYAGMLKAGMNAKGEKISLADRSKARNILGRYMKLFGLRF